MNENYLAIDIGTTAIKAVEKDASGRALRWGILESPGAPLHSNISPFDPKAIGVHLRKLIDRMGARSTNAIASVPAFLVITTVTSSADDRLVPAAPGSFYLSASQLPDGRFFLRALPHDVMARYENTFQIAGLELKHLEMESFAEANLLGAGSERQLLIDVGGRATTFTVTEDHQVIFTKHSDFGLASRSPNVIMEEADNIADLYGVKRKIFCGGGAKFMAADAELAPNAIMTIANGL